MGGIVCYTIYVVVAVLVIIAIITLKMLMAGGIYVHWRHSECFWRAGGTGFCDITTIDIELPERTREACLTLALDDDNGKRTAVPFWKAGRTIPTSALPHAVHEFYAGDALNIAREALGVDALFTTSLDLPTSCALLVYDKAGDFINWHYDVNYFDGRFFTCILPLTYDETCTSFVYMNAEKEKEALELRRGKGVLFEGERVFHMATKLCPGQTRVVLSMQFTTDPTMSGMSNKLLHAIKDAVAFT